MTVHSRKGRGTTFTVMLRAQPPLLGAREVDRRRACRPAQPDAHRLANAPARGAIPAYWQERLARSQVKVASLPRADRRDADFDDDIAVADREPESEVAVEDAKVERGVGGAIRRFRGGRRTEAETSPRRRCEAAGRRAGRQLETRPAPARMRNDSERGERPLKERDREPFDDSAINGGSSAAAAIDGKPKPINNDRSGPTPRKILRYIGSAAERDPMRSVK